MSVSRSPSLDPQIGQGAELLQQNLAEIVVDLPRLQGFTASW